VARIVLNTFGSLGDLHPYLAIALQLREHGHNVTIATSEIYRAKILAEGIDFAPVRPNTGELMDNSQFLPRLWHPRRGTEYLIREYILPTLEQSYADLLPICSRADLLLTHIAGYAGPLVAEKLQLRWLSVTLQPAAFFSVYDPPVLAPAPWLRHLYRFGKWPFSLVFAIANRETRRWAKPVFYLRKRLGLPDSDANPILKGHFSPFGTLALFSRHFAQAQPDWPEGVQITGFAFYDKRGAISGTPATYLGEMDALNRFLNSGPPPVLFTLGSSAFMQAGNFYSESIKAIRKLGLRAVLLTGSGARGQQNDSVFEANYVPYSQIMPRVAISVHQGGIGTTAQALRAGRPMLVVPWAHDQPDNAERARKLGVARVIPRSRYQAARIAKELTALLEDPRVRAQAQEIGARIRAEDGIRNAVEAIERLLHAG
jgi:rhamnosyltransferase subunit B